MRELVDKDGTTSRQVVVSLDVPYPTHRHAGALDARLIFTAVRTPQTYLSISLLPCRLQKFLFYHLPLLP